MKNFSDRLKYLIVRDGLSRCELADKLKVSRQAVQFWAAGRNEPSGDSLDKLANFFNVTREWLKFGIDENSGARQTDDTPIAIGKASSNEPPDVYQVGKYFLQFSAGAGCSAPEWVPEMGEIRYYTASQIQRLGIDPERVKIAEVSGDSMYPTILDGDEILFEEYSDSRLGAHPIVDGGIYTISIGDDMKVKRLSKIKNGIRVRSDNSDAYPDEIYAGEECDQIRVYGRVVQILRNA